jgi:hypothetical protein
MIKTIHYLLRSIKIVRNRIGIKDIACRKRIVILKLEISNDRQQKFCDNTARKLPRILTNGATQTIELRFTGKRLLDQQFPVKKISLILLPSHCYN